LPGDLRQLWNKFHAHNTGEWKFAREEKHATLAAPHVDERIPFKREI
jgi:hypothetical protein